MGKKDRRKKKTTHDNMVNLNSGIETLTLYVNGPNLPFKERLSYQIKKNKVLLRRNTSKLRNQTRGK